MQSCLDASGFTVPCHTFHKDFVFSVSSHLNVSITRSGPLSVLFTALPADLRRQIPGEFLLNEQITMQECFKKQCQVQGESAANIKREASEVRTVAEQ